jgi:hypothetical protein
LLTTGAPDRASEIRGRGHQVVEGYASSDPRFYVDVTPTDHLLQDVDAAQQLMFTEAIAERPSGVA